MQRTTHQFQLSDLEFDALYELAGMPKEVSKGVALRTILKRHAELLIQYANLQSQLKQLNK